MAEKDVSNFSSSSSHRLATISAAEALLNSDSAVQRPLSTGLSQLDAVLERGDFPSSSRSGGLSRGQVTEIYGPPGVGKTTFALQLGANTLKVGNAVVWLDTAQTVVGTRLQNILSATSVGDIQDVPSSPPMPTSGHLNDFQHFTVPTLPHLLALLVDPIASFPRKETSLIVVDTLSTLVGTAFPRLVERHDVQPVSLKKSEAIQWAMSRKWSVVADLVSRLGKLAATKNVAVVVINQTNSRIRSEAGVILHSALSGKAWDSGISTRIVLFRDWILQTEDSNQEKRFTGARLAGVIKGGRMAVGTLEKAVPFMIKKNGLVELQVCAEVLPGPPPFVASRPALKRKRDEIADSESEGEDVVLDEDFGWTAEELMLTSGT